MAATGLKTVGLVGETKGSQNKWRDILKLLIINASLIWPGQKRPS